MAQLNLHHGKGLAITIGADAEVREFKTNEALTAGDWVGLDCSTAGVTNEERVEQVLQGNADGLTIGVALETVASGALVRVCVAGYVEGAKTDGSVDGAGNTLVGAASGAVAKGSPSNSKGPIGIALETDSSGTTADVYIFRRF